jgi:hypothetical protein
MRGISPDGVGVTLLTQIDFVAGFDDDDASTSVDFYDTVSESM